MPLHYNAIPMMSPSMMAIDATDDSFNPEAARKELADILAMLDREGAALRQNVFGSQLPSQPLPPVGQQQLDARRWGQGPGANDFLNRFGPQGTLGAPMAQAGSAGPPGVDAQAVEQLKALVASMRDPAQGYSANPTHPTSGMVDFPAGVVDVSMVGAPGSQDRRQFLRDRAAASNIYEQATPEQKEVPWFQALQPPGMYGGTGVADPREVRELQQRRLASERERLAPRREAVRQRGLARGRAKLPPMEQFMQAVERLQGMQGQDGEFGPADAVVAQAVGRDPDQAAAVHQRAQDSAALREIQKQSAKIEQQKLDEQRILSIVADPNFMPGFPWGARQAAARAQILGDNAPSASPGPGASSLDALSQIGRIYQQSPGMTAGDLTQQAQLAGYSNNDIEAAIELLGLVDPPETWGQRAFGAASQMPAIGGMPNPLASLDQLKKFFEFINSPVSP